MYYAQEKRHFFGLLDTGKTVSYQYVIALSTVLYEYGTYRVLDQLIGLGVCRKNGKIIETPLFFSPGNSISRHHRTQEPTF